MKSFIYAFRGIGRTIIRERNMRIHLCFAFYVIMAGFVCEITAHEWLCVILCIGAVTAFECVNTALEALCDTVTEEKNSGIRLCKDAAAGAVLLSAIASAVVGGVIFFNAERWNAAVQFLENQPVWSGIIILMLLPAVVFVRRAKKEKTNE